MIRPQTYPYITILLSGIIGFICIGIMEWSGKMMNDEIYHFDQVQYFLDGKFFQTDLLTTIPGLHFFVFLLLKISGIHSLLLARILVFLSGFVGYFYLLKLFKKDTFTIQKTSLLQYFFNPLLFPYLFVFYTDWCSLSILVIGFYYMLQKKHYIAGLVFLLSLLVRQSNIVWVFLATLISVYPYYKELNKHWKDLIPYALNGLFFIAFVYLNGGIAIGDASAHPEGIYIENTVLSIVVFGFLYFPLLIDIKKSNWTFLKKFSFAVLSILIVFGLLYFTVDHKYNQITFFIHNIIALAIRDFVWAKLIAVVFGLIGMYVLFALPLLQKKYYLLYLIWPISLLSIQMIEFRYYIVPFVLFGIFRKKTSQTTERIQCLWMLVLSLGFLVALVFKLKP